MGLITHPATPLLVAAVLAAFLPRRTAQGVLLLAPAVGALLLIRATGAAGDTLDFFGYALTPLRADGLGTAFAAVFLIATTLAVLFGWSTMRRGEQIAAGAAAGCAVGVVLAGDLFTLFIFWESKAIATTFLVWARRDPRAAAAGMRYLLVHVAGGSALLGGIVWHVAQTGSVSFTLFEAAGASWLILGGFLLSAAVPPLHAWIADAYPEATPAGTVFLSAYTTKAAVYALARGFPGLDVLLWVGVAMALYGVVYAILEDDIRRLLCYHIVSQVGYMVAAIGVGTEGAINGATAHAFAHILYKGLLLMGAGAVLHATGRSRLTALGGLARAMPWVAGFYLIGALSIAGFPLFSGFVSKELAVEAAAADGRWAVEYLLKLVAIGTFLSTTLKLPYFTWWGTDRRIEAAPVPVTMLAAMGLAAAANIVLGFAPGLLYALMPFPVDYEPYSLYKVVQVLQVLLFTGIGFVVLLRKLGGEPTITLDTDWLYRRLPALAAHRFAPTPAVLQRLPRPVEALTRRLEGAPSPLDALLPRTATGSRPSSLPTWWLGLCVVGTSVVLLAIGAVA